MYVWLYVCMYVKELKMPKIGRCALKATLLPKTARWRPTGVMSNHLSGAFRADLTPLTCRFCGLPLPSPPSAPKLAFGGGGGNPWPVDLSGRRTRVARFVPPGKRLWPPRSARAIWRARSSGWASRAHAMYNSLCSPYIAWALAHCHYRAHFRTQIAGAQVLGDTDRVTERLLTARSQHAPPGGVAMSHQKRVPPFAGKP